MSIEQWIHLAREGSPEEARAALGSLFALYRRYLLLIAVEELQPALQGKVAPSDVVQETLLDAHLDIRAFQGDTAGAFLAWLRQILKHNLLNLARRYATQGRRVAREVPLGTVSNPDLRSTNDSRADSPSEQAIAREQQQHLEQALRQLPAHYREVLLLHLWEKQSVAAIGEHLCRSVESVKGLLKRAVRELKTHLENPHACA
jgi:RNA polymerase sigma-70 factor (ECF subfamily)